jgi:broad specificity phosphatase PhoE
MRLLLLARHGQSLFNVDGVVNGDPARDRGLAPGGVEESRGLGMQIAGVPIDLCVVSAFPRAQQTAQLALAVRESAVPTEVDAGLDDIRVGDLEGHPLADYRAWKRGRTRADPFPGGESLDAAERAENTILCVCHEIPVRYAVNAATGSRELDGPLHGVANATPYLFDADSLRRAVEGIRRLASG